MRHCLLFIALFTMIAARASAQQVNTEPMPVRVERAFPNLVLQNPIDVEQGLVRLPRPVALTHAGDGTNRVFIVEQRGVIHVIPNDQMVEKSAIFLDLSESLKTAKYSGTEFKIDGVDHLILRHSDILAVVEREPVGAKK